MQVDPESLISLLGQHLSWYPLMELDDVYKLLYQGVMGAEHLLTSPEKFKSSLLLELEGLRADPAERLLEPVSVDNSLLRLNLRPWKARHCDLDVLIIALLQTGQMSMGNQALLQAAWVIFIGLCEAGRIDQFATDTVHGFGAWLVEKAFPVVHHSDIYRQAYHPAYRLVATRLIPELGLADACGSGRVD